MDGTQIPESEAYLSSLPEFWISIYSYNLSEKLCNLKLTDLPLDVSKLGLNLGLQREALDNSIVIWREKTLNLTISFEFQFDLTNWKKPWSISDFGEALDSVMSEKPLGKGKFELLDEDIISGFCFKFPVMDATVTVDDEIDKWIDSIDILLTEVEEMLLSDVPTGTLITYFNFPEETHAACEQYLIYFVQFLKDIGVEANTNLRHESGRVLFAVTPVHVEDALDKIREALEIYLKLPSYKNVAPMISLDAEIGAQRLMANIQHLNGQLSLAQAIIQSKDATIEAKEMIIHQLKQGSVFIDSMESAKDVKSKDQEDLLGGAISLKSYEGDVFDINFPMLFRGLRKLFVRKK